MGECPGPPPEFPRPKLTSLPAGEVIYRIHEPRFGPAGFNPGDRGRGRVHPMDDPAGQRVPTLYGALDFETALCEGLFRGRPRESTIPANKVRALSRSLLRTRQTLNLVNLYLPGLRAIHANATTLIESPERCYAATARWAEALYPNAGDARGMLWRSRQRPETDAMIFWQPNMPDQAFEVIEDSTSLASPTLFQRVLELAGLQGITITLDD